MLSSALRRSVWQPKRSGNTYAAYSMLVAQDCAQEATVNRHRAVARVIDKAQRPELVHEMTDPRLVLGYPRVGFIVTNLTLPSRAVVRFHNKRGTAGQWIKEGKQAVKMTRLSCHRFRSNEARLWLTIIAYNLGNLWRRLVLPQRIGNWSLTSLQRRLVKTGGRLVKHARYYWLLLAESHLTRPLFGAMVQRMAALTIRAG